MIPSWIWRLTPALPKILRRSSWALSSTESGTCFGEDAGIKSMVSSSKLEGANGSGWLGSSARRTCYRCVCELGHYFMWRAKELSLVHTVNQWGHCDMVSVSCGVVRLRRVSQMGRWFSLSHKLWRPRGSCAFTDDLHLDTDHKLWRLRGSCVFTDDLNLDTDVFHLEEGNCEICNLSYRSQGYSPFASYEKGVRTHVEIHFFSHLYLNTCYVEQKSYNKCVPDGHHL